MSCDRGGVIAATSPLERCRGNATTENTKNTERKTEEGVGFGQVIVPEKRTACVCLNLCTSGLVSFSVFCSCFPFVFPSCPRCPLWCFFRVWDLIAATSPLERCRGNATTENTKNTERKTEEGVGFGQVIVPEKRTACVCLNLCTSGLVSFSVFCSCFSFVLPPCPRRPLW